MEIDIEIDKFTPCLIERKTGREIKTRYYHIKEKDVKNLKWLFNWSLPFENDSDVVALSLKDSAEFEGLVSYQVQPENQSVYVELVESAPHNKEPNKQYEGVGGHLFAIAVKRSFDEGYNGHIYFQAKTELIDYYVKKFNATIVVPKTSVLEIAGENAKALYEEYLRGSVCDE
jgi:hypothetical protein